jgi:transcriptional regulator with XRE-family HTH domain
MPRGQTFDDFLAEELEGDDELAAEVHEAFADMRLAVQITMGRERAGMSQMALALKSGVSQPMISHIERGDQQPTWPTIMRLLTGLGMSLIARPDGTVAVIDGALELPGDVQVVGLTGASTEARYAADQSKG